MSSQWSKLELFRETTPLLWPAWDLFMQTSTVTEKFTLSILHSYCNHSWSVLLRVMSLCWKRVYGPCMGQHWVHQTHPGNDRLYDKPNGIINSSGIWGLLHMKWDQFYAFHCGICLAGLLFISSVTLYWRMTETFWSSETRVRFISNKIGNYFFSSLYILLYLLSKNITAPTLKKKPS